MWNICFRVEIYKNNKFQFFKIFLEFYKFFNMRVVATGVFELIHPGHILFLNEAKKLGDELIVIVSRDVNSRKNLVVPEDYRLKVVKELRMVDSALLGDEKDIFKPVMELKPDIIALGKNQNFNEKFLEEELRKRGLKTKVVRIEKFFEGELNSTSKIKEKIKKHEI